MQVEAEVQPTKKGNVKWLWLVPTDPMGPITNSIMVPANDEFKLGDTVTITITKRDDAQEA